MGGYDARVEAMLVSHSPTLSLQVEETKKSPQKTLQALGFCALQIGLEPMTL